MNNSTYVIFIEDDMNENNRAVQDSNLNNILMEAAMNGHVNIVTRLIIISPEIGNVALNAGIDASLERE